jgi:ankyrin repeat protein
VEPGKQPRLPDDVGDIVSLQSRSAVSGANRAEEVQNKGSALLFLVKNSPGNLSQVKALLANTPDDLLADVITQRDEYGNSPLSWAVERGYSDMVTMFNETVHALLDKAVTDNNLDLLKGGLAALPAEQIAKILIQPDPDQDGATLLHQIVKDKRLQMAEAALQAVPAEQRADVLSLLVDNKEYTPLRHAIDNSDVAMVRSLLEMVPAEDRAQMLKDNYHSQLSGWAAGYSRDILKRWAATHDKISLIIRAAASNEMEIVQAMLEAVPANQRAAVLSSVNDESHSPLFLAIYTNPARLPALLTLLPEGQQRNACLNQKELDYTPLQTLEDFFNEPVPGTADEMLEEYLTAAGALMAYGADPDQVTPEFKERVVNHCLEQIDKYRSQLQPDNLEATPAEERLFALKMLQWTIQNANVSTEVRESIHQIHEQHKALQNEKVQDLLHPTSTPEQRLEHLQRIHAIHPVLEEIASNGTTSRVESLKQLILKQLANRAITKPDEAKELLE